MAYDPNADPAYQNALAQQAKINADRQAWKLGGQQGPMPGLDFEQQFNQGGAGQATLQYQSPYAPPASGGPATLPGLPNDPNIGGGGPLAGLQSIVQGDQIALGDPGRPVSPRPVDPNDPSGGRGTMPPGDIVLGDGGKGFPPRPGTFPPGPAGPISPPGPGNLPPRPGGFDPRAFAKRLNPQQQADFAALRRNTGGNFTNLGGEAGLMKRYNVRPNVATPPGPGNLPPGGAGRMPRPITPPGPGNLPKKPTPQRPGNGPIDALTNYKY